MNVCAVPFDPGIDELQEAGLTAIAGDKVACPRIGESPVAFECRQHVTLEIGASRQIILGEVLAAHIEASIVNDRFHIDPHGLDAIGRMGGHGYAQDPRLFRPADDERYRVERRQARRCPATASVLKLNTFPGDSMPTSGRTLLTARLGRGS